MKNEQLSIVELKALHFDYLVNKLGAVAIEELLQQVAPKSNVGG